MVKQQEEAKWNILNKQATVALKAGQFSVRVAVMSYRCLPSAPVLAGGGGQETSDGFYSYLWFEKTKQTFLNYQA